MSAYDALAPWYDALTGDVPYEEYADFYEKLFRDDGGEFKLLLDLCYEEDSAAQVDLNCVMTGEGELVELQGTGEGRAFTIDEQRRLVDLCAKGIREVQSIQKAALGG